MRRWMIAAAMLVAGCVADTSEGDGAETADGIDDSFLMGDAADGFGIAESDPRACAVLRLANEADAAELGLLPYTRAAAQYVIAHRAGPDMRERTGDDDRIQSLVELDAIPYVGPTAFNKWL